MSLSGIGNATAGNLIADDIKSAFTTKENKAATKGDLKHLVHSILRRYHLVKKLDHRHDDGALPYYDMETKEIVYSIWPL